MRPPLVKRPCDFGFEAISMKEIEAGLQRLGWRPVSISSGRTELQHRKAGDGVLVLDHMVGRVTGGVWASLNASKMKDSGWTAGPYRFLFPDVWITLDAWCSVTPMDLIHAQFGPVDPGKLAAILTGDPSSSRPFWEEERRAQARFDLIDRTGWRS